MRHVYVNLPHYEGIAKELNNHYKLCSKNEAHAIVTEYPDEFSPSCFVIIVRNKNPHNGSYFIDSSKDADTILTSIIASLDTFFMTKVAGKYSPYMEKEGGLQRITYFMNKLEHILNSSPESIVEIDLTGDIFFYNRKFAKVYQDDDFLIEENIFKIFDETTAAEVKRCMGAALQGTDSNFSGKLINRKGESISIAGHVIALSDDSYNFEIVFDDITTKITKILQMRKIEEQSIVAGFSRHLSHNVMNALTAAGGFIRQIKLKTESDAHIQNLWKIVDNKLSLIEEIIAGYNDYTHAISFKITENVDLYEFLSELIVSLSEKNIDRNFTAYLYKFVDSYNAEYDITHGRSFHILANKMFLKLAVCYILKDNIRYFSSCLPLKYRFELKANTEVLTLIIDLYGVEAPDYIIDSMFSPWKHTMLSQSFDYWGIVIAGTIVERHHGKSKVERIENGLRFSFEFKAMLS